MNKTALVIQGPHSSNVNNYSTIQLLEELRSNKTVKEHFYLILSVWNDESIENLDKLKNLADKVVILKKPEYSGAGNRYLQANGVINAILEAEKDFNFDYVLKSRSDIKLSEKYLNYVIELKNNNFNKLLTTNIYTLLEPFHLSDLVMFSTKENIKAFYCNSQELYYEDLYSPEVQFTRAFIRKKQLNYYFKLEDYLKFLRDFVLLIDFKKWGLIWIKNDKICAKSFNSVPHIRTDRDAGVVLMECITESRFNFIKKTFIPLDLLAAYYLIKDIVITYFISNFKDYDYSYTAANWYSENIRPLSNQEKSTFDFNRENLIRLLMKFKVQKNINKISAKYKNKKIIIYGAGLLSEILLKQYDYSDLNIIGVMDRRFEPDSKETFLGFNTFSPNEINNIQFDCIISHIFLHKNLTDLIKNKKVKILKVFKIKGKRSSN